MVLLLIFEPPVFVCKDEGDPSGHYSVYRNQFTVYGPLMSEAKGVSLFNNETRNRLPIIQGGS